MTGPVFPHGVRIPAMSSSLPNTTDPPTRPAAPVPPPVSPHTVSAALTERWRRVRRLGRRRLLQHLVQLQLDHAEQRPLARLAAPAGRHQLPAEVAARPRTGRTQAWGRGYQSGGLDQTGTADSTVLASGSG